MRNRLPLLLAILAAPVGAAEITLRESVAPTRSIVRLGDVATIRGEAAEAQRLAQLPLMPAPTGGDVQHVRARAIRDLMRALGEDPAQHRFSGSPMVIVGRAAKTPRTATPAPKAAATRPAESIGFREATKPTWRPTPRLLVTSRDRAEAKRLAREAIELWLNSRGESAEPLGLKSVELGDTEATSLTGTGAATLTATPVDGRALAGDCRFRLTPLGIGEDETVEVTATLVALPIAVVATEPLARGDLVTASRVETRPLSLDEAERLHSQPLFDDAERVLGQEASRTIRAGEPLSSANCRGQVLVRRGEAVEVVSGGGGVTVRLQAIARSDGRHGDLVDVEALDRRERFAARVVGRRRLAIIGANAGEARLAAAATEGLR